MRDNNQGSYFFLGLFVAAGLALGGYFIGQTMYNAKVALNTAEVKGLAERQVKADKAIWDIVYVVKGSSKSEIPSMYKEAEKHQQTIISLLKKNGFEDVEIMIGALDYAYQEFRDDDKKLVDQTHKLIATISLKTQKIDQVSRARNHVSRLIARGINISNRPPAYYFTRLNEIKPDMLQE